MGWHVHLLTVQSIQSIHKTTINNNTTMKRLSIDALATATTSESQSHQIYDLQGRQLKEYPTHHGVYIVNGKKTIIK